MNAKICTECTSLKSFSEFTKNKRRKDGLAARCRSCDKERYESRKEHINELRRTNGNPEFILRNKRNNIWAYYKLTPDEYDALIANGCEVCGTHENLAIDHDHNCCPGKKTCGKCIRGVLCRIHNLAEGYLQSDPNLAMALAAYMLKNQSKGVSSGG